LDQGGHGLGNAWAWQGLGLVLPYAGIIIIIIIIKQLRAKVYASSKGTLHVRGILIV